MTSTYSLSLRLGVAALAALIAAPGMATEPDWSAYDALLSRHVSAVEYNGVRLNGVDYPALAVDPSWPSVIATVETFPLASLSSDAERIAFYINAYNIFALRLVAEHYPLDSIKDIGNLLWPVWKRTAGHLDGKALSLDAIEHNVLRKLGEPRMHFAIVCASISCPDLRSAAYRGASLDGQLDEQVRAFLDNGGKGLRRRGSVIEVSRIFDWFAGDFGGASGVATFIARFHELPVDAVIKANIDYDWRVNTSSGL